jgi:hypothetical protein
VSATVTDLDTSTRHPVPVCDNNRGADRQRNRPSETHIKALVRHPIHKVRAAGEELARHGLDEVLRPAREIPEVPVDLGLDVEQHGLVCCARDKVEQLGKGGDFRTGVHL